MRPSPAYFGRKRRIDWHARWSTAHHFPVAHQQTWGYLIYFLRLQISFNERIVWPFFSPVTISCFEKLILALFFHTVFVHTWNCKEPIWSQPSGLKMVARKVYKWYQRSHNPFCGASETRANVGPTLMLKPRKLLFCRKPTGPAVGSSPLWSMRWGRKCVYPC